MNGLSKQNLSIRNLPVVYLLLFFAVYSQQEKPYVAVRDLESRGVSQNEVALISEQFRAELSKSNHFRIIERNQMADILKEQGFQQSGACTDDACAVQIGQILGVRNIVVGSIGTAGNFTILTARILDVETGEVVATESIKNKGGIDDMIEYGVVCAARQLTLQYYEKIFPQIPLKMKPCPKKKGKGGKVFLIGGISAVVVGGGVTAAIFPMNREPSQDADNNNNVRIDLP